MTAPFSPTTTYADDSLPAISAQDLNDLQKFLYTGWCQGAISAISQNLDGVGNVSYPFKVADSPLVLCRDTAGNVKSIVDHNGYRCGRTLEVREEWLFVQAVNTSSPVVLPNPIWTIRQSANASFTVINGLVSTYVGNYINLTPGTLSGNFVELCSSNPILNLNFNYISTVLEFEFFPQTSTANITWNIGWVDQPVDGQVTPPNGNGAWFTSVAGGVWNCVTQSATGTRTSTPTTVSPALSTPQRFRLEIHGSASPYGANTARFFINDVLVATNTATFPLAGSGHNMFCAGVCTGAATGFAGMGSIFIAQNRWLSVPGV